MAIQVTKYQDSSGALFDTELEADASSVQNLHKIEVDAFINTHFPTKKGSLRGNPHAGTAAKAIFLWIAYQSAGAHAGGDEVHQGSEREAEGPQA